MVHADSLIVNSLADPRLIAAITGGEVVVLPTDTVYGICALASDSKAVSKLYGLKSREKKPGTVIAESIQQLTQLGIKKRYLTAVEVYWPGPVSVEIPHDITHLNQGTGRQAFRIVKDAGLTALLKKTGPLLTSSCNLPGEPPANNIREAIQYFNNKISVYVDGGDLSGKKPSTLIRVVDDMVEVLREGAVEISESGKIL